MRQVERSQDAVSWKPVVGWPDYEVSSDGRIRKLQDGIEVKQTLGSVGYYVVMLSQYLDGIGRIRRQEFVHRVVCFAFHGKPPAQSSQVAHNDGNPTNNRSDNLRWVTAKGNAADRDRHGTARYGEQIHWTKLNPQQVVQIRKRLAAGEIMKSVAAKFGISESLVSLIAKGKIWKRVGGPRTIGNVMYRLRGRRRKLSSEQVRVVRTSDLSNRALAKQFNVDPSAISRIRSGKSYQ